MDKLCWSMLVVLLTGFVLPTHGWDVDTGFGLLYTTNKEDISEMPVIFNEPLPHWLNGTFIRNGPGMFEVGKRKFNHLFDGFSKPVILKFNGSDHASLTSYFLKTNSYMKSMRQYDIAPYVLYMPPDPPFNWKQRMQQLFKGLDNMNMNVVRVKGQYLFLSDLWSVYTTTMPHRNTILKREEPQRPHLDILGKFALSSSHPMPDDPAHPDGYLLNYYVVPSLGGHTIHIAKMLSANKRQFLSKFSLGPLPYMHSFGATNKYVILFGNPLYISTKLMLKTHAATQSLVWKPKDGTTLYIIDKHEGLVKKLKTDAYLMTHHVNAFEKSSGIIVADFLTYRDPSVLSVYNMKVLANKTARNHIKVHKCRLRRFVIDLNKGLVTTVQLAGFDGLPNRMELPVINENYRYRPYCYVYGLTMQSDELNFSDFRLVKRDLCGGEEYSWGKPGFYPSEPWFIAKPAAIHEDDGFLLCIILDGERKVSYLGVFDARNLEEVNRSYLSIVIPFVLHGKYFL